MAAWQGKVSSSNVKTTSVQSFAQFRHRLMLRLLIITILLSIVGKYANLVISYWATNGNAHIGDVAGFELVQYAPGVRWVDALQLGGISLFGSLVAVALLKSPFNRRSGKILMRTAKAQALRGEIGVYFVLLIAAWGIGKMGIDSAASLAALNYAPLLVFSLLHPKRKEQSAPIRLAAALGLSLLAFVEYSSKVILLDFVLAVACARLYRGRVSILAAALVFLFIAIYPYLNIFRNLSVAMSATSAFNETFSKISVDFLSSGLGQILLESYGKLSDRLVGLDGVLVASTTLDQSSSIFNDLSQYLFGVSGVGISLGLMGQLLTLTHDAVVSSITYSIVIFGIWRFSVIVDRQASALGFGSFGLYIYIKAIQTSLGGFRLAEMKLIWMTIGTVLLAGIAIYLVEKTAGRHSSWRKTYPSPPPGKKASDIFFEAK